MALKPEKKFMTRAEFARAQHVSRQMVTKWIAHYGMPITEAGLVDVELSRQWLRDNTRQRATNGNGHAPESLVAARARKESALASLREYELEERRRQRAERLGVSERAMLIVSRRLDWCCRELPAAVAAAVRSCGIGLNDRQAGELRVTVCDRVRWAMQSSQFARPDAFTPLPGSTQHETAQAWVKELKREYQKVAYTEWVAEELQKLEAEEQANRADH
jgi:hypothetical protein